MEGEGRSMRRRCDGDFVTQSVALRRPCDARNARVKQHLIPPSPFFPSPIQFTSISIVMRPASSSFRRAHSQVRGRSISSTSHPAHAPS